MDGTQESGTAGAPGTGSAEVERRSIVQNVVDLMSSQVLTWVLAAVLTVVQPRYLGPEGQGQLRLAYSIWLMADVMVGLGTSTALTLAIARDREHGLAMVRPVLTIRAVGYLVAWGVVAAYLGLAGADRTSVLVTVLIGVVSVFFTVAATARAALIGLEQMRFPAVADVVTKVVAVVAVITVLVAGGDVVSVALVTVVTASLNAALMMRFLRRFPSRRPPEAIRTVLRLSVGLMVADAALIVYQQIDTLVMSALVDKDRLGWYATADQLFGSLLFVPTILVTTLFPVFGRLTTEDPGRLRHMISRAMASVLLVTVPIGLGAIAVGRPLARFIYGDAFDGAGQVMIVMGFVLIVTSETILVGRYVIATGRQRFWNAVMVGGIVLTIPLDLVFVPWSDDRFGNGAIGGAMSYAVTESLMLAVGIWRFGSEILAPTVVPRFVRTLAAGGVMLAVVWPLRNDALMLPIVVGGVVYPLSVWILRALGPEERRALARLPGFVRSLARR